jgi:hypothetical protein
VVGSQEQSHGCPKFAPTGTLWHRGICYLPVYDIAYLRLQTLHMVYSNFRFPPSVLRCPGPTFCLQFSVILPLERVRLDKEECGEERKNAAGDHEVVDPSQTAG